MGVIGTQTNQRPTEKVTGVAGAVAAILMYVLKLDDPGLFAAVAIVLGALPSAVTWIVETVRTTRRLDARDESGYTIWEVIGGIIIALILAWFALEVLEILANDR